MRFLENLQQEDTENRILGTTDRYSLSFRKKGSLLFHRIMKIKNTYCAIFSEIHKTQCLSVLKLKVLFCAPNYYLNNSQIKNKF